MPKPSNVSLLAERKAIRALLDVDENVTTLDAVTALNNEVVRLRAVLKSAGQPPTPFLSVSPYPERIMGEAETPILADARLDAAEALGDGIIREKKPLGVAVDTAIYLPTGQTLPPLVGPEMSAVQGDLTPNYCRWFLSTNGPAETVKRYGERVHLLPEDVRRALA